MIRTKLAALFVCAALALVALTQTGCSREQQLRNIDSAIAAVEQSEDILDSAENLLARVDSGLLPWQDAWEAIAPALPPEAVERVNGLLAAGLPLREAVAPAIMAARIDRERALTELRALREKVANAPDPVTSTLAVVESSGALLALVAGSGAVGAVITGVVGVIGAIRNLRKGREQGASETASILATGRVALPELDAIFEDDANAATRAMKARMAQAPTEVAAAIKKANELAGVNKLPAPAAPPKAA